MEASRFDQLAVSVASAASSRRSLLRRVAGGGLASVLAAIGISGFSVEEAEAKKSCQKKCKQKAKKHNWSAKKKKACKDKCKKKEQNARAVPSPTITNNTINTTSSTGTTPLGGTCTPGTPGGAAPNPCGAGTTCLINVAGVAACITNAPGVTCAGNGDCTTGFCANIVNGIGLCLPCGTLGTTICGTGANQQCCAVGITCSPLLDICIGA